MRFVPSRRLLGAIAVLCVASLVLLIFPGSWPVLLSVNLTVFLMAVIDLLVTPSSSVLQAMRLAPERLSVLNQHRIAIRVRNASRVRLRVRVRDGVPPELSQLDIERSGLVPAQGEVEWDYTVQPRSRGQFAWGPIFLRYRSLLGLWDRGKTVPPVGAARVYPNLTLLERFNLLARSNRLASMGIRRLRFRGVSTEFESLREYTSGDDVRQMDWKATARRARLIVRNRETERNQTVLLLIDCGRLMNATDPVSPVENANSADSPFSLAENQAGVAKLDHAVNAAMLLAHVALARGDRVGLCTFSGKVHAWLTPRGHLAQSRLIGETLYDLRGDYTESDHARCLKFVASRFPKRSLLVVLTDFVDGTTAAEMITHLQLAARRHVVLFAAMKDAFVEQASLSDPLTEKEGFRKAAALDLLRERREVLERIRHVGGFVVDTEPGDVAPAVISNYLEVMMRGLL
jgi:uncharacterized protein (DUF58 family)